jgi:hypothetical protein
MLAAIWSGIFYVRVWYLQIPKLKYTELYFFLLFCMVVERGISDIKGRPLDEGLREQGTEDGIWTYEGGSNGKVDKIA